MMKRKRKGKERKRERKKVMGGFKQNLINKRRKKIYFPVPPICTVPTWKKKYHFGKGGGGEYYFLGKYIPLRSGRVEEMYIKLIYVYKVIPALC